MGWTVLPAMSMSYPRVSIITPSFNHATFLERTILSVLEQRYPNLEYIIIDGGSTDGSMDIIMKHAKHLAYWVSEPDHGQVHAINKGLKIATGDWIGWQNSDDVYYPGSIFDLTQAAAAHPHAHLIIGNMMLIDEQDDEIRDIRYVRPTYRSLLAEGMVLTNQAAFWRRSLHEKIGYLNEEFSCGFDYEWFLRVTQRCKVHHVNKIWGGLRIHNKTKSSTIHERFEEEYRQILHGRETLGIVKRFYQFRRLILTLVLGNVFYVLRGIGRRILGGKPPHIVPLSRHE
jgi:glycosyltransferase involved in cell wall biosynthesis